MVIGDGTEAATGDAVTSKKDGKTYTFVKPKGQYAVVTDPNGEDPGQAAAEAGLHHDPAGQGPGGDLEVEKPKTATGEVPALGMMAVAKDGWAGEITLISPDGKFVFITDANGKRKRKSTGTVSITSRGLERHTSWSPTAGRTQRRPAALGHLRARGPTPWRSPAGRTSRC
jgi:DNA-binding beta-propeller fold protein YncE